MSTLSLISGAETIAASFHLLIDEFLLSDGDLSLEKRSRLSELLRAIAEAPKGGGSHDGLLLDSLLRDPGGRPRVDLERLASSIEEGRVVDNDLSALNEISIRVSSERAALSTRTGAW